MNLDEFLRKPPPFLAGMCESHLRRLADCAEPVRFSAGTRIFREGDSATQFYLIRRGRIVLQTHAAGRAVNIQTIGAGDVLGWSWLFAPYCWHLDACVEEETDAVCLDAARVRQNCEADTAFGYALMKRIAGLLIRRLQATRLKLVHSRKTGEHPASPVED